MTTILEHVAYAFIYGFIGAIGVAVGCGLLRWVPVSVTLITQRFMEDGNQGKYDTPPEEL